MNWLLLRLLALLLPGIDDDLDDEPPADDDAPADDADDEPPADDDAPVDDDEPDLVDEEPAPRETRAQKNIRELRERSQKAEADLVTARAELEAARRSPAQPAQPSPEQTLWQQEEETLRNPETSDWQKYAINSARAARESAATSRQALQRAEDMGDRAEFAELAAAKPKLFAAYKDRVEERLKDIRQRGGNVARKNLLAVMLGEDMLAGKIKAGDGAKPKPAAPRATPRSDVSAPRGGNTGLSDSEKRARRLENVRI